MQSRLPRLRVPLLGVLLALTLVACSSSPNLNDYEPGVRIGTYDGRAVAIAYGGSKRFDAWISGVRARHATAKAAGDQKTMRAIDATMRRQQETLHGQAFRGASVDDILALVPDDVARITREAKVGRIERVNLRRPGTVETVDVTDEILALFHFDDRTRAWAKDIRTKPFQNSPRP